MFLRAEINFTDGFEGNIYIRLVFNGCKKAIGGSPCYKCHNPSLWDFHHEGTEENRMAILKCQLEEWKESGVDIDGISLIGGEPLDQDYDESVRVLTLVKQYFPDVLFFLYTGLDEEKFFRNEKYRFHPFAAVSTYIKFGPYVEEMKTPEDFKGRPFLGSTNQSIYEVIRRGDSALYKKISIE